MKKSRTQHGSPNSGQSCFSSFFPLDQGTCGTAHSPVEVNKCPLNGKVEDLFRLLIDARFVSHISASGCNLTGTLKDLSSLRQESFRLGNSNSRNWPEKIAQC